MKNTHKISRIAISIVLAALVFTETGIWTAIAILVLLLGMEAVSSSVNKIRNHVLNMDRIDMREAAEKIVQDVLKRVRDDRAAKRLKNSNPGIDNRNKKEGNNG